MSSAIRFKSVRNLVAVSRDCEGPDVTCEGYHPSELLTYGWLTSVLFVNRRIILKAFKLATGVLGSPGGPGSPCDPTSPKLFNRIIFPFRKK